MTASAPDPLALARRYDRLFNERRLDEGGQLVHPEAQFHYVPTHQRVRGRAGHRALAAMWLNACEDAVVNVVALRLRDETTVEADLVGRGTHIGDLVLGEVLTLPATGRLVELPFQEVLRVRDGLIATVRLEFDVTRVRREGDGAPPSTGKLTTGRRDDHASLRRREGSCDDQPHFRHSRR